MRLLLALVLSAVGGVLVLFVGFALRLQGGAAALSL
jgi:hypothetical protein